jgi:RNA polymerase sigma-70 factor, ECF subfamily
VSDPDVFTSAVNRHRWELEVYCYRLVGSFSEAEDLVQDTLERAWRTDTQPDTSTVRAWLYKIATNVCIDHLRRRGRRRVLPFDVLPPAFSQADLTAPNADHLWIEPFPDSVITQASGDPGEEVIDRETIELAFIAAVQQLPTIQRVVFIARDVMGWSARATSILLDSSVPAVKSALQRARRTMRERLPRQREEWARTGDVSDAEWTVVRRYIEAHESGTVELADVLAADVRVAYPAIPVWSNSRDAFIAATRELAPPGEVRLIPASANLQPAVAIYLRPPGEARFTLVALEVLRISTGRVTEIIDFDASRLPAELGLEHTLT